MKKLGKVVVTAAIAIAVVMPVKMVSVQACENYKQWNWGDNKCFDNQKRETKPCETKQCETKPCETKPCETKPCETKPCETKPIETETKPIETETKNNCEQNTTNQVKETTKEIITIDIQKDTEKNESPQTGEKLPIALFAFTGVGAVLFVVATKAKKAID